jgi:hypothetical protein
LGPAHFPIPRPAHMPTSSLTASQGPPLFLSSRTPSLPLASAAVSQATQHSTGPPLLSLLRLTSGCHQTPFSFHPASLHPFKKVPPSSLPAFRVPSPFSTPTASRAPSTPPIASHPRRATGALSEPKTPLSPFQHLFGDLTPPPVVILVIDLPWPPAII